MRARYRAVAHEACDKAVSHENVGQKRRVVTVPAHIAHELFHLARVVSQLADHELGTGANLLFQLQILGVKLAGAVLEGVHHRAHEKRAWLLACSAAVRIHLESLVHRVRERHELHAV